MTKKLWQNLKYLENEKSFYDEEKIIFIILKGLSIKQMAQIFLEGPTPTLNQVYRNSSLCYTFSYWHILNQQKKISKRAIIITFSFALKFWSKISLKNFE